MTSLTTRATVLMGGAAALLCLAYRGLQLYGRNIITISITEVVNLPPIEEGGTTDAPFDIKGKIEVDAYLIRNYRFLFKLAAATLWDRRPAGSGGVGSVPNRNRVLSSSDSFALPALPSRRGSATLMVEDVDEMVDRYELSHSGLLCFTPASLQSARLLTYTAALPEGVKPLQTSMSNSLSRSDVGPGTLDGGALSPRGEVVVSVHHCLWQADEGGFGHQRLSLHLQVAHPVFCLQLLIRLPSRRCRLVQAQTGGIGRVVQPFSLRPHHIVWEIGSVNPARDGPITPVAAAQALESRGDAEALTRPSLLYDIPFTLTYDRSGDCGDKDAETDSLSSSASDGDDDPFCPTKSCQRESSTGRTADGGISRPPLPTSGKPSPPNHSNKASKRAARSLQKLQESQRRRPGAIGLGGPSRKPTLELNYSTSGLASGISVRKLQVLSETPNWQPRALLDRVLLRCVPSLQELKLQKYAHYTTWFVQPVSAQWID